MTVALVVHPSAELYGSDRVTLESVRALVEGGCAVHTTLGADGPLCTEIAAVGSPVTVVPTPVLRKALLSPMGLLRLIAQTARSTPPMLRLLRSVRPSVVYVSTLTAPWWIVLARLRGARVVCHVHEAEESVPRVVRVALAAPLLLAHRVIANSERSRAVITDGLPVLAGRVRVIYNGVPGPSRISEPRAHLDEPVRLAIVGRVSPRKGTDVAVAALERLVAQGVDAELDIVGGVFSGYEWFEDEVRASVERAQTGGRVHWHGVQPEIWDAVSRADIALVPSRVEPFGNAAVEAMLAGRPVIAGDTQGLREIVNDGVNGLLVRPGDAGALVAAIARCLADWPATRARAAVARTDAAARFGTDRYRRDLCATVLDTTNEDATRRRAVGRRKSG